MAHIFADNVREGSVSEGTGNFVTEGGITAPGGVIIGRTLDEVLLVGDTFDYSIFHSTINEWEIGVGEYLSTNTFSRNPSSSSSNGALVDFSPGVKQVFIAPVAARMTDVISDDNLPHIQSGKTFTSTVTVTGESGLRVNAPNQEWSIGGTSADPSDFASTLRNRNGFSTLYVDLDKLPQGFSVRSHQSSNNFVDILRVSPDGAAVIGNLSVTASSTGRIGTDDIKTVSGAGSSTATTFPLGHTIIVVRSSNTNRNSSSIVRLSTSSGEEYVQDGSGDILTGTWRARGRFTGMLLMERMA